MSDLEILASGCVVTLSDGRAVTVREMTFGETPKMLARFGPLFDVVAGREEEEVTQAVALSLMEQATDWRAFIVATSDLSENDVDALSLSEVIRLATAAQKVNAGFFEAGMEIAKRRQNRPDSQTSSSPSAPAGSTPSA